MNWGTYRRKIQLTVAHWFLILLFLASWSAFLGRRYRRLRRKHGPLPVAF